MRKQGSSELANGFGSDQADLNPDCICYAAIFHEKKSSSGAFFGPILFELGGKNVKFALSLAPCINKSLEGRSENCHFLLNKAHIGTFCYKGATPYVIQQGQSR